MLRTSGITAELARASVAFRTRGPTNLVEGPVLARSFVVVIEHS